MHPILPEREFLYRDARKSPLTRLCVDLRTLQEAGLKLNSRGFASPSSGLSTVEPWDVLPSLVPQIPLKGCLKETWQWLLPACVGTRFSSWICNSLRYREWLYLRKPQWIYTSFLFLIGSAHSPILLCFVMCNRNTGLYCNLELQNLSTGDSTGLGLGRLGF